jgi:putative ABC transport system ATP-binding protein
MKNLIEIERLKYSYLQGNQKSVPVLQGLDLAVRSGEFIAVTGPSGSGKTTLINIIGLLTDLQRGSYVLDGHDISKISTREKENLRARYIGFIFQDYLLLDHLSVAENVLLPLQYSNLNRSDKNHLAHEILERLGISSLLKRKPSQLSGGQKQRVAIARAIVKKPRLIIADEPASALDPVNRLEVLKTLQELSFSGTAAHCLVWAAACSCKRTTGCGGSPCRRRYSCNVRLRGAAFWAIQLRVPPQQSSV